MYWTGFDPCSYVGLTAKEALILLERDGLRLAGPEFLMAAFLFPEWISAWNKWNRRTGTPFASMSALQAHFDYESHGPWGFTPNLYFQDGQDPEHTFSLDLWARRDEYSLQHCASPTVRVLN